jgi:replicative superfamily II helicase
MLPRNRNKVLYFVLFYFHFVSQMTEIYLDPQFEGLLLDQLACIDIEDENVTNESNNELLPPLVPREYQYELYKRAISENIIAVLDTGAGKTLISVMLIKHMLLIENENCAMMPGYKVFSFFLKKK